jgi:hypothetical protein
VELLPFPFYGASKPVEWWDGIGGQMVLAKKKQAVSSKSRGRGSEKQLGRGRTKLNKAAEKKLEENSEKIVQSLLDCTLKGNVSGARLLIALADGEIDCENEEVMQRLCSYAEGLASEPEWKGDPATEPVIE